MKINNNISAVITNKHLLRQENSLAESMERLSSGLKLNHASDSPAGMAISSKMQAQIDALDQASRNASDVQSVLETADGGLEAITNMLQRIRELAVQAANDTNSQEEKDAIQLEVDNLKEEVDRIATTTEFNTKHLLDGSIDKRVYADNVSRVSVSDAVNSGLYSVEVTDVAKPAILTMTAPTLNYVTGPGGTQVTAPGTSEQITINGQTATIGAGMTAEEVWAAVRDAAELGEVTAEEGTGGWTFTSVETGRSASVTIENSFGITPASGNANSTLTNGTQTAVFGIDPKVDLYRGTTTPESVFTDTAKVAYKGNRVIITDDGGFKLDFLLDADMSVPKDIEFDVADIGPEDMQVGANEGQQIPIRIPGVTAKNLYLDRVDVSVTGGASRAIAQMDDAIAYVNGARATVGAYMNRVDHTIKSIDQTHENMTASISRITDTNMAEEMSEFTKYNVLVQAATSALSQANELPQQALQLLG